MNEVKVIQVAYPCIDNLHDKRSERTAEKTIDAMVSYLSIKICQSMRQVAVATFVIFAVVGTFVIMTRVKTCILEEWKI
jgi:hypothetical protein